MKQLLWKMIMITETDDEYISPLINLSSASLADIMPLNIILNMATTSTDR